MGNVQEGGSGSIDTSALKCQHCNAECRSVLAKILHEDECRRRRVATTALQVRRVAAQMEELRKLEELKRLFAAFNITMKMLEDDSDNDSSDETKAKEWRLRVGTRVVRGPSWKWDDQDGGEGYVGTVIKLEERLVDVCWDKGTVANYRAGMGGSYDLLVLDNAPAGVKHPGVTCDGGCSLGGEHIRGTRWKCWECEDFDLCTPCYMGGKHLLRHRFIRFDNQFSAGCLLSPRSNSSEVVESKGVFPGATVCRGLNWGWRDQDGGKGKLGRVTKIIGFRDKHARDAASVLWGNGNENNYMVGCNGDVDVKCVLPGKGIKYYKENLLPCGVEDAVTSVRVFRIGDSVKFTAHPLTMKIMQRGHGAWHNHMIILMDKAGKVKGFETNNDVLVKYDRSDLGISLPEEDCVWRFNPAALRKG